MQIRRVSIVVILLMTAISVSNVVADSFIRDADSNYVEESDREHLDSSKHVLRYRVVAIESEELRKALFEFAELASKNGPATLELRLFDDVLLIANVLSEKYGQFRFFVKARNSSCNSPMDGDGSNGSLEMSQLGHITGRFWVCDKLYTIGPIRDLRLPYHVVSQLDPQNLPSID